MTKRIELEGQRFGRLVAVEYLGKYRYRCACDCGAAHESSTGELRTGKTRSCGCLRKEVTGAKRRTHAKSKSRTYHIWQGMKNRCYNTGREEYQRYGAKGVTVCDRWHKFENFLADMGECPNGLTLERVNNARGYEPGNCRWATVKEQNNNSSRNVRFAGRTLASWAKELGMTSTAVAYRIKKYGTPIRPDGKRGKAFAKVLFEGKPLSQWAKELDLPYRTVRSRFVRLGTVFL